MALQGASHRGASRGTAGRPTLLRVPGRADVSMEYDSHEGYVESDNRRWDECAREHDVALMKAACIKDDRERRLAREEADVDFATCLLTVQDRAPFKFSEIGEDSLGYELAIIFWIFRFNRYRPSAFDPSLCSLCPGGSGSR